MRVKALGILLLGAALLGGCTKKAAEPAKAADGKVTTVRFNYTLTVDGKKIDSSEGKPPLSVTLGKGQVIPGLEEALAGMKAGDKRVVTVPPEKGYGPYREEGIKKVPKAALKDLAGLKPGMVVNGQAAGQPFQAVVKAIGDKDITLDLNHPMAGKTLNFDVEIVSVGPAGT